MHRLILCAVAVLSLSTSSTLVANSASIRMPIDLKATVDLYLSGDPDYLPGDLITNSHLGDIQVYLRRTQGNSLATHSKWRRRMLTDDAPLVRLFYAGNRSVLRKAASELGGYAKLDQLSRSGSGRRILLRAIENKSAAELIQYFSNEQPGTAAKQNGPEQKKSEENKNAHRALTMRIYTVADYIAAVTAPMHAKPELTEKDVAMSKY